MDSNKDKDKDKNSITTDKALIFSAIMIILFTIAMIVMFYFFQSVPDSLVVAFFAAFACEGGYCAFIHKIKKQVEQELEDNHDDKDLVIDLSDEEE